MTTSHVLTTSLAMVIATIAILLVGGTWTWIQNEGSGKTATYVSKTPLSDKIVPDEYIVQLHSPDYITLKKTRLILRARWETITSGFVPNPDIHGISVTAWNFDEIGRTFGTPIRGFSVRLSPAAVAVISKDSAVKFIEPNARIQLYNMPPNK